MRFRSTLVLLILVILLGSIILLFERRLPSTDLREQRARQAMAIDPDVVTDLRIEAGDFMVECVNSPRGWRLRAPLDVRADAGAMDRLLAALAALPRLETITARDVGREGLKMEDYGLVNPRARIIVGDLSSKKTFAVGRDAPLGASLYLLDVATGDIVVTETNLLQLLPRTVADVRERALFVGDVDQARRLEIRTKGEFIQLVKDPAGNWILQQPVNGRADRARIGVLLDQLIKARALDFVAEQAVDLEAYGLDDSAAVVLLAFDDKTGPQVLELGDPAEQEKDRVYAKLQSEKPIVTVSRALAAGLNVTADELRDRRLLEVMAREINGVALTLGDSSLRFARTPDEGWRMLEPRVWDADVSQVSLMISQLAGLRIESFADAAQTDLLKDAFQQPALLVQLSKTPLTNRTVAGASSEGISLAFAVSTDLTDRVWVRVEKENLVCSVSNRILRTISADPLFYRDREVLNLETARVVRLSVKTGEIERALEEDASGQLQAVAPEHGTPPEKQVREIVLQLSRLTTMAFVAVDPKDLSPYGLAAPRAEITLQLAGRPPVSKTLLIGDPWGDGGVFAMLRGEDVVFVLPADLYKRLAAMWEKTPAR